jgi:hypothetical protein
MQEFRDWLDSHEAGATPLNLVSDRNNHHLRARETLVSLKIENTARCFSYHTALKDGSIENVLRLFSNDGSIREPIDGLSGSAKESELQDSILVLKTGA